MLKKPVNRQVSMLIDSIAVVLRTEVQSVLIFGFGVVISAQGRYQHYLSGFKASLAKLFELRQKNIEQT